MASPYSYHRINRFGLIKIRLNLWLIFIYTMHHILLLALSITIKAPELKDWVMNHPLLFLASIPTIILMLVESTRLPSYNAHAMMRKIWNSGRMVLISGVLLDTMLIGFYSYKNQPDIDMGFVPFIVINIGVIFYLIRSEYITALFDSFPEKEDKATK
ncbi:MAG: DUF2919 family protein [Magnetococcales bacterium]|nr:DUF2919 family protein [Magnetococcales bacterium]